MDSLNKIDRKLDSTEHNNNELLKNRLKKQAKHIRFEEEPHQYFNEKNEEYRSVSSLISQFTPVFDTETISKRVAKRDKLSVNQVTSQWNIRRDLAIVRGTEFHLYVETFLETGKRIETITPIEREKAAFHLFWDQRNQGRYEVIVNELRICDDEYKIAGTIDCIVRNRETNNFFIFDWKTNRNIKTENKFEKMLEPLNQLDSCEFTKYSLQMTFYCHMLKKSGLLDIKKCYLIHLFPAPDKTNKSMEKDLPYNVLETQDYSESIPAMMEKINLK